MTSAYEDLLSFYVYEFDFDCCGHVFQSANEHKGISVRPALVNSVFHWMHLCVKPVSGQLGQQCHKNKEVEMCFYFTDDLCAKWSVNNELGST